MLGALGIGGPGVDLKPAISSFLQSTFVQAKPGGTGENAPMNFPMYTVPLEDLLQMTDIQPHEVLRARDVLVEFHESRGNGLFVSHQWVGAGHPDPDFKQLQAGTVHAFQFLG